MHTVLILFNIVSFLSDKICHSYSFCSLAAFRSIYTSSIYSSLACMAPNASCYISWIAISLLFISIDLICCVSRANTSIRTSSCFLLLACINRSCRSKDWRSCYDLRRERQKDLSLLMLFSRSFPIFPIASTKSSEVRSPAGTTPSSKVY